MSTVISKKLIDRAIESGIDVRNKSLYLPAVNASYAAVVDKQLPTDRTFPEGYSLKDLAFWSETSNLFQHPFCLLSVGHFEPFTDATNSITETSKNSRWLLADSAGYQCGTGALAYPGLEELKNKPDPFKAIKVYESALTEKTWQIMWLERNANYAMTLDCPPWAKLPKHKSTPFHHNTFSQFLELTKQNLELIRDIRTCDTRWVSVVQGFHPESTEAWIQGIEEYDFCNGFALAGGSGARGGLYSMLHSVLYLKERNLLNADSHVLHALGVSTPFWSVVLTCIQQHLRNQVSPDIVVTFDSSSPFLASGCYEDLILPPKLNLDKKTWSMITVNCPQEAKYVGSTERFNYETVFGDALQDGHLSVKPGEIELKRFDSISNHILAAIDLHSYLMTFQRANELFEDSPDNLPAEFKQCIDVINEAFSTSTWRDVLLRNKKLLDRAIPSDFYDVDGLLKVDWP